MSLSRFGRVSKAEMESFFGSLKEECVGNRVYSSHEQAKQALIIESLRYLSHSMQKINDFIGSFSN